jgi:hypothetical protein
MNILESICEVYQQDKVLGQMLSEAWKTCIAEDDELNALNEGWIRNALGAATVAGGLTAAGVAHHNNAVANKAAIQHDLKERTHLAHHLDKPENVKKYQADISDLKKRGVSVVKEGDRGLVAIDTDGNEYDGSTGEELK